MLYENEDFSIQKISGHYKVSYKSKIRKPYFIYIHKNEIVNIVTSYKIEISIHVFKRTFPFGEDILRVFDNIIFE